MKIYIDKVEYISDDYSDSLELYSLFEMRELTTVEEDIEEYLDEDEAIEMTSKELKDYMECITKFWDWQAKLEKIFKSKNKEGTEQIIEK